jgi:DNA invertase Pin-like site-specific DNA recombinase
MRGCCTCAGHTASGAQTERKGLTEALSYVRAGDTLVVWKLDRLGRSLKDLITRITQLNDRKIGFKSLTENIDTTTSGGKLGISKQIDVKRSKKIGFSPVINQNAIFIPPNFPRV